MKTIEYIFKSNPEIKLEIPEEYAQRAEELINLALSSKNQYELWDKILVHPRLKGKNVPPKINDLMLLNKIDALPEKLKVQDSVYLLTCARLYIEDMDNKYGFEREEGLKHIELIKEAVEKIENLRYKGNSNTKSGDLTQ